MTAAKAKLEANEAYLKELYEKRDNAVDEESKKEWEEQIKTAEE
jgi:hypothetical protein